MKRLTLINIAAVVVAALVITAAFAAQGPGRGLGAKACQQGQPCPYGYDQPGPQGRWWTDAQPATPEQKAFIDRIAGIHKQIRDKNLEIGRMRAENAPQGEIAKKQAEIDALRTELHDVMYQNRELRQQIGGFGMGRGRGAGRGGRLCPNGYEPGTGRGGWWNNTQPQTPEQQAFTDKVASLHEAIRAKQFELADLKASNASQDQIARAQAELESLRDELHDLMYANRDLRQQMGGRGMGRGRR